MGVKSEEWTKYLAIRAAWMSFVAGHTQTEIAKKLGVSQAKVHRLIAQAQKAGLIRIHIEGRPVECLELEDALTAKFDLDNCIVAPFEQDKHEDDQAAIEIVGAAAGTYLQNLLTAKKLKQVGVGMGRTLVAAVSGLPTISRPDLDVVSISGSLTRKLSANPYDVVQRFQARTGGDGYFLPVPYLARSREENDIFHQQDSVRELLARARNSDLFVIGIGSLEDEGHLMLSQMISDEERHELFAKGVSGELMGRFLNTSGQLVETELGEMAVGLHFEEIRGARVLAVVGGASKADSTTSALRSGVITELVIDECLANLVLARAREHRLSLVGEQ